MSELYQRLMQEAGLYKCVQSGTNKFKKNTNKLDLTANSGYIIPSLKDSRQGIMKTLTISKEIMPRGNGVGINISVLRPKYTKL